jgi:Methyltransferase domain
MSSRFIVVRDLAREVLFERPAGIRSGGMVRLADVGLGHHERVDYTPLPWRALPRILPPVSADDVFVDIGVGKGRVLCQAARYPFARCIGVELSDELAEIARANVETMRRRRARSVEVVTADGTEWPIPDDVTMVFLNNPFVGESFARAAQNLVASLDRRPRRLQVIYVNPWEHEQLLATGRFRQAAEWRVRRDREYPLNLARLYQTI